MRPVVNLKLRIDSITESVSAPTHNGYGVTIYNQGTHRMFIANMIVLGPGQNWIASADSLAYIGEIPNIRFEDNEWREYVGVTIDELPVNITTKGKLGIIHSLQPISKY